MARQRPLAVRQESFVLAISRAKLEAAAARLLSIADDRLVTADDSTTVASLIELETQLTIARHPSHEAEAGNQRNACRPLHPGYLCQPLLRTNTAPLSEESDFIRSLTWSYNRR
jgi:hypothetical protein